MKTGFKLMSKNWKNTPFIYETFFSHLQGLDKSPEERSDALSFTEQFDQPQDSEQSEEGNWHFSTFTFALDK